MRRMLAVGGVALFVLVASSAPAAAQANVAGRWAITIEGPQGPAGAVATLVQDGATFTGEITMEQAEAEGAEITEGAIDGNTMSFVLMVYVQGAEFPIQVTGEVDGDKIAGEMSIPDFGAFPWSAERSEDN